MLEEAKEDEFWCTYEVAPDQETSQEEQIQMPPSKINVDDTKVQNALEEHE